MQVTQDQQQQTVQVQKIAPHLIQASEILQCSTQELLQTIERELMENPALESAEQSADGCSDCPFPPSLCNHCPRNAQAGLASTSPNHSEPPKIESEVLTGKSDDLNLAHAEHDFSEFPTHNDPYDEYFDPLSLTASDVSLRDHLLSALRATAHHPDVFRVAEYLISCLDERGWLKLDVPETLALLGTTEEILHLAVAALQNCDPPGIGARDLRECLLLQLCQHIDEGTGHPLAKVLIEKHWENLAQRRYEQIARRTRTTVDEVAAAVHFIQNELTPAPAGRFRQPWEYKPDTRSDAIRPDVIIRRSVTGFEVEVQDVNRISLHVNMRYRRLYENLKKDPTGASLGDTGLVKNKMSPQERRHVMQYVERADLFLKNLQQRQRTIERIAYCLIEAQQGFIETGSKSFLLPLTRTELARRTGLHESTVSRALLHKYVQLPNQDVMPFDAFFASAGSAKEYIAGLITSEDPDHPLSDETLRLKLEEMGTSIARRTIVKYREALRIPASYLRRRR